MLKTKKLTVLAALALFSLSGPANAMLPLMMLLMGPMMGVGGLMQGTDGHGDASQGASPAEGSDPTNGNMGNHQGGDAAGEWRSHDALPGTSDPAVSASE